THYNDDATAGTYAVEAGSPLVQSRFSLAKLAWLSQANPDTGSAPPSNYATAIRACFGLDWGVVGGANGGNPCWNYVGSTGGFNGTIKTLDQVAQENREPNFFELLKAAILSGSLGQEPGPCAFNNGVGWPRSPYTGEPYDSSGTGTNYRSVYYVRITNPGGYGYGYGSGGGGLYSYSFDRTTGGAIPAPARISDLQIIRIGANIIDQYDADSWPTAIYFQYPDIAAYDAATAGNEIFGPVDMVFGDENLPLLQAVVAVGATTDGQPQGDLAANGLGGWWQPQLWNPHQQPGASPGIPPPRQFAIKGFGPTHLAWAATAGSAKKATGYTSNTLDGEVITLTDSNPLASAFYASPKNLTEDTPNVSVTTSHPEMKSSTYPGMFERDLNPFVGFWMGTDVTYRNPAVHPGAAAGTGNYFYGNNPSGVTTFWLGWVDSGGGFHPYSCLAGVIGNTYWNPPQLAGSAQRGEWHRYADSRTQRFSQTHGWGMAADGPSTHYSYNIPRGPNQGPIGDTEGYGAPGAREGSPPRVFTWDNSNHYGLYEVDWEVNSPSPLASTRATPTYYTDPDGVIRPGDGVFGTPATGDGMMLFTSNGTPTGSPFASGDKNGNAQHGRRPVILNRPFRSVGELGHVFRDLPFKTLDFFTTYSADAALPDVFSLVDSSRIADNRINAVVAGEFNPNNAPVPAIQAVLVGGSKKDLDPAYNLSATQGNAIAQNIANLLNPATGANPLVSRADLAVKLGSDPVTGGGLIRDAFTSSPDKGNKAYLESPVRALADVTNTRTWNLLIDVVAQSGRMAPTATALDQFMVEGERRYWLHVAIDRFTGKVVDQQLEPVYE
ncbi:MAG: hypothetical protein WC003_16105, partial [Terrimicrobiaceae bacterium]